MSPLKKLKRYLDRRKGATMIRKAGFWFVDIPRTSSSSIKVDLGRHFGPAYGKTNLIEQEYATEQIFSDHIPAHKMRNIVGARTWDNLYTFTIVRNPWDRILSLYFYLKKRQRIPDGWNFPDYVKRLVDSDEKTPYFGFHGRRYGAVDYILDENSVVVVDEILRYENRAAGLRRVACRIGLPNLGSLRVQAASPTDGSYRAMYDDTTRELIGKHFARDVLLLDYEF